MLSAPENSIPMQPTAEDNFSRDPYWATFRAGEFDFSVIAVHVIWGEYGSDQRKAEVKALAEVYEYVQDSGTVMRRMSSS